MGRNRWPIKYINTLWENKTGEHGKKVAKCYLQAKATYGPPWDGNTTPTHKFVRALQLFKGTYVVLLKLHLEKCNDIIQNHRNCLR